MIAALAALDSSFDAPTLAQAQQAAAAGVRAWGGYLATVEEAGAFNLAAPWSRLAFWNVQQAGLRAIAFCSGWDDPAALRVLADQWGVLPLLDCEDGIRGDGDWVDGWLKISGFGLYGLLEVHRHAAPYRIVADYPGADPEATWSISPAPAEPHGWQWEGSHPEFGLQVDRSWLDDWFGGPMFSADDIAEAVAQLSYLALAGRPVESDTALQGHVADADADGLKVMVDHLGASPEFSARIALIDQLLADYRAGKLGGTPAVVPPHTHPVTTSGTSGGPLLAL